MVVDFTGVPGVDNNPQFGIRIVNAATGNDCVNFQGGAYNNSSGQLSFRQRGHRWHRWKSSAGDCL